MAVDSLGLSLRGNQLAAIPPNASPQEQNAAINQIISTLNSNSQDVVMSGKTNMTYGTVAAGVVSLDFTMVTIPHNLGYKPRAYLYLNNTNVTFQQGTSREQYIPGIDTPLPCPVNGPTMAMGGFGGGGGLDPYQVPPPFWDWLWHFVDKNNLYIIYMPNPKYYPSATYSTDPAHYTIQIAYELHRQATGG